MKRMFKKLSILLVLFVSALVFLPRLVASSGYIGVSSSKSSVTVGETFNVTITFSSSDPIGSWDISINYDSSKLSLVSGETHMADALGDGAMTSKSYYLTFKAIASGTSTISVGSSSAYDWNLGVMSLSSGSATITASVYTPPVNSGGGSSTPTVYSSNNNLKTLGVEGYELNPVFDKDTLEYTVLVPSSTEKVKLFGELEETTAVVTGLDELDVSEGKNRFEVKVKAQNGSEKIYVVTIEVIDENPIEVSIDGLTYTVVKRASNIKAPDNFDLISININGAEVPAFKNEVTNLILVGLKNKKGETDLYIYDQGKESFTLYNEVKTSGVKLVFLDAKEVPEGYKLVEKIINGKKMEVYQYGNIKDFFLMYGLNLDNNEEGWYEYDVKNNLLIRYNDQIINYLIDRNEKFLLIIIVLAAETLVVTMLLLASFTKKNKRKKRALEEKSNKAKIEEVKKEEKVKENKKSTEEDEFEGFEDLRKKNRK